MPTFDGRQLMAARALAEVTVAEPAKAAGVTARTINRFEVGGRIEVAPKRWGPLSKRITIGVRRLESSIKVG
jgi:hypothetical protein